MPDFPFKISARAAGLIGKENIASAEGAIIELVKNSYDADATDCIIFFDLTKKNKASLLIIDNGTGMDDKIIQEHWMKIGTANKLYAPLSPNKRIKSGAKGIGRFALDRLGEKVKMFTVSEKMNTAYEWNVNWNHFIDSKTLDEVFASLDESTNLNIYAELKNLSKDSRLNSTAKKIQFNGGTFFYISELRDLWDKESISKLYKNLEVLVPPKESSDFRITLLSSKHHKEFGVIKSPFWDDYDYKLDAKFNDDNTVSINLNRREFNWKSINPAVFKEKTPKDMTKWPYNLATLKKGGFSYKTDITTIWPGVYDHFKKEIINLIGPFEMTFYFLKRSTKEEDKKIFGYRNFDANKRREWLDRFGGIKLFRDNFRVRPYGEIDSNSWDWLELGQRTAASTFGAAQEEGIGWRVNPNQVYGVIRISRVDNPELKDTTNREGLVANETFNALQELILRLISILENDRHFIMRPMRVVFERENEVERAKEEAKKQADDELAKQAKRITPNKSRKASKNAVYAKAVKGFELELKEKEDEIKMLRSLASIGMTISTFTHELGEIRRLLNLYARKLRQYINSDIRTSKYEGITKLLENPNLLINKIIDLITGFGNWIDFSNDSIKKDRRKATDLGLLKYFNEFKKRWQELLDSREVDLIIDKSLSDGNIKKGFPIDLDSIFNNLLLNSMDAFYRKDSGPMRRIIISAYEEEKGIAIIYEDSGPGLLSDIKKPDQIFEPFFTTKRRGDEEIGIGLGMWIVKTTIEQYNGYIEILQARKNFKVKIFFPR